MAGGEVGIAMTTELIRTGAPVAGPLVEYMGWAWPDDAPETLRTSSLRPRNGVKSDGKMAKCGPAPKS